MLNSPQFLAVLKGYGLPVAAGRFSFDREVNLDELGKRLAIDEKLAAHIKITEQYWYETYGITKPLND